MPKPSCTCMNCEKCAHREYMRKWRTVVFPTDQSWERSIAHEVSEMLRYRCPLNSITAASFCIDLRRRRKEEKVMYAGKATA